jgi:enoyl-CoA hydratase
MSYQTLTCEKKEHVAIVSLLDLPGGPESVALLSNELSGLCAEMGWDEEIWVVLLVVHEEALSMDSFPDAYLSRANEGGQEINFFHLAEPIAKLDKPVIAAIKGKAIGQGLELALACDIRIVSETSLFGLPQIKSGLIPWNGGTQRLSRLVGKGKALEMMLTGEMLEAQEALRIGLVNRIFSPDKLMTAAMEMAKEMASKGPISLRYIKEATYKGMDMTLEQGLHLEADLYLLIHTTKDRTEGIRAFQQKRIPKFEGK